MDADYYLETISTVFQEYRLVNGTWDVRSPEGKVERVRPQDITTTALFTVEGELDDISGSGQTEAAHDLCTGIVRKEQRHLEAKGAGHYGIFSGRRWRELVYPQVKAFIVEHQLSAAPASKSTPSRSGAAAGASTESAVATAVTSAPTPRPRRAASARKA
jgi:poly(3-hydroxybutyrate) depolymerase